MGDRIIIELESLQEKSASKAPNVDQPRKVLALHRHFPAAASLQRFKAATALLASDGNAPLIECADGVSTGYNAPYNTCPAIVNYCSSGYGFENACPVTCNNCASLHFEFTGTRKVCHVSALARFPIAALTPLPWQVASPLLSRRPSISLVCRFCVRPWIPGCA